MSGLAELLSEIDERRSERRNSREWPSWLSDERFEVEKINCLQKNYHNMRQRRVISLTRDGCRVLKPDGTLRKFHPYSEVAAQFLVAPTRLCLSFFKENHDLVYETPKAALIFQSIAARKELFVEKRNHPPKEVICRRQLLLRLAEDLSASDEGRAIERFVITFLKEELEVSCLRTFLSSLVDYATKRLSSCDEERSALTELFEETLLMPLMPTLTRRFAADSAEVEVAKRRRELRSYPPSCLGVSFSLKDFTWARAIDALSSMDERRLPSEKLRALMDAAEVIYDEARPHFLTADDFLPIFIVVFIRAKLQKPFLTRSLLWALGDPLLLRGEHGYYLTMFDAALDYVYSGSARRDADTDFGSTRHTHHRLPEDCVSV